MKMCSISVAPMPSMMRMPVASRNSSQVGFGSVSPADTQRRSEERLRSASAGRIARYAVGAVKSTVARCRATCGEQLVRRGLLDQQRAGPGAQREDHAGRRGRT